jgi:hypothetical protein
VNFASFGVNIHPFVHLTLAKFRRTEGWTLPQRFS